MLVFEKMILLLSATVRFKSCLGVIFKTDHGSAIFHHEWLKAELAGAIVFGCGYPISRCAF